MDTFPLTQVAAHAIVVVVVLDVVVVADIVDLAKIVNISMYECSSLR